MKTLCQNLLLIAIAAVFSFEVSAAAPGWRPSEPVELIVAAGPGSVHDRLARTTARIMEEGKFLPTPLGVVNRAGGGGTVALAYLSKNSGNRNPPISTASGSLLTGHITGGTKYNYTDFTVLSVLFADYNVFSVRADSPIKSGMDLMARLKSDPKSVSFAFAVAAGNYSHIAIARVAKAAQADVKQIRAVVHDGGGKAAVAVLGGHIDVLVGGPGNIIGHVEAGKMRAIALSAPQRYEAGPLANTPTWREQGVDVVADLQYYFLGPKGMQQGQIEFWEQVFSRIVKMSGWKEFAQKNHWVTLGLNRTKGAEYLKAQYDAYRESLEEIGLASKE